MTANIIPIREPQGSSLYQILEDLAALLDTLDIAESDEARREIEAEINAICEREVRKVDAIANYLATLENQQRFAAEEMKRLQARKAAAERKQQRLEAYVIRIMEQAGLRKLEGRTNTFTLRPCPASVRITDELLVPPAYQIERPVEMTPDKRAIRAAIEAGECVDGTELVTGKFRLERR